MIDMVLSFLFRCSHRRMTIPITPAMNTDESHSGTYVVCLACGKQFTYDTREMRIGKPIVRSHGVGVLPPNVPMPRKTKLQFAALAALSVAVVLGAMLKRWKRR